MLAKLVPDTGRVPPAVEHEFVKVLTIRPIGYGHGVSNEAAPIYHMLFAPWSERHLVIFLRLPHDERQVSSWLQFDSCAGNFSA